MNTPKVSLIVPVWIKDQEGMDMTIACLDSMEKTNYPNYDIIIVDDCSPFEGALEQMIALYGSRHKVTQTPQNGGSTVAVNYGLMLTDAPFVQYQNNDTLFPDPNWLTEQMRMFEDSAVGIVGCLMRYPTGLIQHAGACWRALDNHAIDHIGQYQKEVKYFEDVPFVTGCGMTVRREVLERNGGGFTVFKGYGWDDIDIEVKAKEWGWKIKVALKAEFVHLGSVTYRKRPELLSRETMAENKKLFDNVAIGAEEVIGYFVEKYYVS